MSRGQTAVVYAIVALIIGSVGGYFIAGPVTYNKKINELEARISELEEQKPPVLSGSLTITGSTTVFKISDAAAELFMEQHPKVDISVTGTGSSAGVKSCGAGEVDIGEASRNIRDSEFLKYPDLVPFAVAKDSVAVVIHPNNPLAGTLDLSLEEIAQIFSGEISKWNELGGEDHVIEVYTRDEASGTRETFEKFTLGAYGLEMAGDATVKASNSEMRAAVAGNKYGIAYISLGYVDTSVSAAKVDGVEATVENVLSGDFPITRILWMFTKGPPDPLEIAFIKYVLSPEGQALVEDLGFIPIY